MITTKRKLISTQVLCPRKYVVDEIEPRVNMFSSESVITFFDYFSHPLLYCRNKIESNFVYFDKFTILYFIHTYRQAS